MTAPFTNMTGHGFARDMDFTLIEQTDSSLTYELSYTEDTLKNYPFKFRLQIIYTIEHFTVKGGMESLQS